MRLVRTIVLAFSMFSRVPMPRLPWEGATLGGVLAALPLVGVLVGASVLCWDRLALYLEFGPLLRGTGYALAPLVVVGGIHLDGFADCLDAVASHGDRERKLAILKDPHLGSFAALGLTGYLLLFAGLAVELRPGTDEVWCFAALFVLSRALCGLALVLFPCAKADGLGRTFRDAADPVATAAVLGGVAGVSGVLLVYLGGWAGGAAWLTGVGVFFYCRHMAVRHFGGMTGDVAGWLVQVCEMVTLGTLVVTERTVEMVRWGGGWYSL